MLPVCITVAWPLSLVAVKLELTMQNVEPSFITRPVMEMHEHAMLIPYVVAVPETFCSKNEDVLEMVRVENFSMYPTFPPVVADKAVMLLWMNSKRE